MLADRNGFRPCRELVNFEGEVGKAFEQGSLGNGVLGDQLLKMLLTSAIA